MDIYHDLVALIRLSEMWKSFCKNLDESILSFKDKERHYVDKLLRKICQDEKKRNRGHILNSRINKLPYIKTITHQKHPQNFSTTYWCCLFSVVF